MFHTPTLVSALNNQNISIIRRAGPTVYFSPAEMASLTKKNVLLQQTEVTKTTPLAQVTQTSTTLTPAPPNQGGLAGLLGGALGGAGGLGGALGALGGAGGLGALGALGGAGGLGALGALGNLGGVGGTGGLGALIGGNIATGQNALGVLGAGVGSTAGAGVDTAHNVGGAITEKCCPNGCPWWINTLIGLISLLSLVGSVFTVYDRVKSKMGQITSVRSFFVTAVSMVPGGDKLLGTLGISSNTTTTNTNTTTTTTSSASATPVKLQSAGKVQTQTGKAQSPAKVESKVVSVSNISSTKVQQKKDNVKSQKLGSHYGEWSSVHLQKHLKRYHY